MGERENKELLGTVLSQNPWPTAAVMNFHILCYLLTCLFPAEMVCTLDWGCPLPPVVHWFFLGFHLSLSGFSLTLLQLFKFNTFFPFKKIVPKASLRKVSLKGIHFHISLLSSDATSQSTCYFLLTTGGISTSFLKGLLSWHGWPKLAPFSSKLRNISPRVGDRWGSPGLLCRGGQWLTTSECLLPFEILEWVVISWLWIDGMIHHHHVANQNRWGVKTEK